MPIMKRLFLRLWMINKPGFKNFTKSGVWVATDGDIGDDRWRHVIPFVFIILLS